MVTRVRFEYRLANGLHRVIAAPSVRPVAAFERQDAAGKWHQEPLQDVPPTLLMTLGRMVADHDNLGVTVTVDGDTMDIGLGEIDAADPAGFLARSIPQLGAMAAPVRHGWREGVTFPVELEESEALLLDAMIREKFFGPVDQRQCAPPPEGDRLLEKVRRVQNKFLDKRRADEEFAATLTDEEREVIRTRRAGMSRMP